MCKMIQGGSEEERNAEGYNILSSVYILNVLISQNEFRAALRQRITIIIYYY